MNTHARVCRQARKAAQQQTARLACMLAACRMHTWMQAHLSWQSCQTLIHPSRHPLHQHRTWSMRITCMLRKRLMWHTGIAMHVGEQPKQPIKCVAGRVDPRSRCCNSGHASAIPQPASISLPLAKRRHRRVHKYTKQNISSVSPKLMMSLLHMSLHFSTFHPYYMNMTDAWRPPT